jgi:hypothetical protein
VPLLAAVCCSLLHPKGKKRATLIAPNARLRCEIDARNCGYFSSIQARDTTGSFENALEPHPDRSHTKSYMGKPPVEIQPVHEHRVVRQV